jgi:hypothetical protein
LDVALSPVLVVVAEEAEVTVDVDGAAELRVQASLRFLPSLSGVFRPAVTLDGEVVPVSAANEAITLPPLPRWTLGLRAGIAGDLL